MPVPKPVGAQAVTQSQYRQPFSTPTFRAGLEGLNLRSSVDLLAPTELARMSNVTWARNGAMTVRPGLQALADSLGTRVHSIARLSDPQSGTALRIWGIDTDLYIGHANTLTVIDGEFSGDPLSIVPYRPPLSGQPWAYIGDSDRMRKVRNDGLILDVGLPSPQTVITTSLGTENKTNILAFSSSDSSDGPNWTAHAGTGNDGVGSIYDASGPPASHASFITNQDSLVDYYQFWSITRSLDLSRVGTDSGTPTDASDDDHIHLFMKISNPSFLNEARIYFVVSNDFDPEASDLPGAGVSNTDAYVKSFRPGDMASFFTGDSTASDATTDAADRLADEELIRINSQGESIELSGEPEIFVDDDGNIVEYNPTVPSGGPQTGQGSRILSVQAGSGAHEWIELGTPGKPLRRSDFRRIGSTVDSGGTLLDWGNVTGIIVYINAPKLTGVSVAFYDMYLTGGAGPDNSNVGLAGYDHRYTDFDPRTGAESNPSPIAPDAEPYGIFSTRQPIDLTPTARGNPDLRQRFYRRGGPLGNNW